MTSVGGLANSFTQIDQPARADHSYLSASDKCYYLGEYATGEGSKLRETNQLIYNLPNLLRSATRRILMPSSIFSGSASR